MNLIHKADASRAVLRRDKMQNPPRRDAPPQEKRDFSLKMAETLAEMEMSPNFRKVCGEYVRRRKKMAADPDLKKVIANKHEEEIAGVIAAAAEEEAQREAAVAKACPPPQGRKRGRPSLPTEEQKARTKERQQKAYLARKAKAAVDPKAT